MTYAVERAAAGARLTASRAKILLLLAALAGLAGGCFWTLGVTLERDARREIGRYLYASWAAEQGSEEAVVITLDGTRYRATPAAARDALRDAYFGGRSATDLVVSTAKASAVACVALVVAGALALRRKTRRSADRIVRGSRLYTPVHLERRMLLAEMNTRIGRIIRYLIGVKDGKANLH